MWTIPLGATAARNKMSTRRWPPLAALPTPPSTPRKVTLVALRTYLIVAFDVVVVIQVSTGS